MCASSGAGAISATPDDPSESPSVFFQHLPPSVVLKSPRGSVGTELPNAPATTTSGFLGSTRIELRKCCSLSPALFQVAPASVDLNTPCPLPCSPVAT